MTSAPRLRRGRPDETGTGVITSVAGLTVFLLMLLAAVQVAAALSARSAITAAAYDAARAASGADGSPADAERDARAVLGPYQAQVSFDWSVTTEIVAVRVRAPVPSILPAALRRPVGLDRIDRTVVLRRERLQ